MLVYILEYILELYGSKLFFRPFGGTCKSVYVSNSLVEQGVKLIA